MKSKEINKIISNGQGYFDYLYNLDKKPSIKEMTYEEIIQLYWREEISTGLIGWLTNDSLKSVTNTMKQKHLIEDNDLDITEKGICKYFNEDLFWKIGANLTREQIRNITDKNIGLFTHLKMLKNKTKDFGVYFLNRNMFYQLWWKEGISDKQLSEELVEINERRIRTLRTEWYKVTYPFVNNNEKEVHKFLN